MSEEIDSPFGEPLIPLPPKVSTEDLQDDMWVEPDWEKQPKEPDSAYRAFLIYRHLPPFKRNLLETARVFFKEPEKEDIPPALKKLHKKWKWDQRVEAYYLHLQKEKAGHDEQALLKIKTNLERAGVAISEKIAVLAECDSFEKLMEMKHLMGQLEIMLGKGQMGAWVLGAQKSFMGTEVKVRGEIEHTHKISALDWK